MPRSLCVIERPGLPLGRSSPPGHPELCGSDFQEMDWAVPFPLRAAPFTVVHPRLARNL